MLHFLFLLCKGFIVLLYLLFAIKSNVHGNLKAYELTVGGNVIDSLTVVILGDVSGDGKINATDLISLVAYIGGSREYTEAQTIAANLQQPARPTINAQDLAFLKGAMDGSKTIVQK